LSAPFLPPHTIAKTGNIERASGLFDGWLTPTSIFRCVDRSLGSYRRLWLISGLYPRIGATIVAGILITAAYAIARVHELKWRWQHPRH
jgi:hypothetical protein